MKSEKLTRAMARLIHHHPFFAVYLSNTMQIVETDSVPTAATDGRRIYFNPAFLEKLSVQEAEFVLAHEVLHGILHHIPRATAYKRRGFGPDLKPFNEKKMNVAEDYVINDILCGMGMTMPQGGLHNPRWGKDHIADEVYVELDDEDMPPDTAQGDGEGHGGFDQHMDAASDAPSEAETQTAVSQAAAAARAQGKMPGSLQRVVEELLDPQVPWGEQLRAHITAHAGRDQSTWRRANRRRLATPPHVYYPGSTGFQLGEVAVVIDTSGSISQDELTLFLSETAGILQECRPPKVHVLWTDSVVAGVDTVDDPYELTQLTPKGGGGTDMEAGLTYVREHYDVEQVVVLTDGCTGYTDTPAWPFDVTWVTTDREPPYGNVVKLGS